MPAITLETFAAGMLARLTRSAMLEVLERPCMRAAAAKGVPAWKRVLFHALPNAAIRIVTILGLNLGQLIAGAIVVQTVFGWPGIGRLLVTAVSSRDLAVVQGLVLVIAATKAMANLTVDLLYGLMDPRRRSMRRCPTMTVLVATAVLVLVVVVAVIGNVFTGYAVMNQDLLNRVAPPAFPGGSME